MESLQQEVVNYRRDIEYIFYGVDTYTIQMFLEKDGPEEYFKYTFIHYITDKGIDHSKVCGVRKEMDDEKTIAFRNCIMKYFYTKDG